MTISDLKRKEILSKEEIARKLKRMAAEIIEAHSPKRPLAIVGIQTRGVPLAHRCVELLKDEVETLHEGTLDISLYRDDLDNLGTIPSIKGSEIDFTLDGCHVILVDDVLFTGRTIRAAIDAIMDYGRPAKIDLAVLIDRGNRELPIAATFVGHTLETKKKEYVRVLLQETDGDECVEVLKQKKK